MKKFLSQLFNDNNTINEKSVVGFLSFIVMILVMLTDLISAYMGKQLPINKFIFDGFMVIAVASFGIGSVDKWINKSKSSTEETENKD